MAFACNSMVTVGLAGKERRWRETGALRRTASEHHVGAVLRFDRCVRLDGFLLFGGRFFEDVYRIHAYAAPLTMFVGGIRLATAAPYHCYIFPPALYCLSQALRWRETLCRVLPPFALPACIPPSKLTAGGQH